MTGPILGSEGTVVNDIEQDPRPQEAYILKGRAEDNNKHNKLYTMVENKCYGGKSKVE